MRSSLAVVSVALVALSGCGPPDDWMNTANMRYRLTGMGSCDYASLFGRVCDRETQETIALVFTYSAVGSSSGGSISGGWTPLRRDYFEAGAGEANHLIAEVREEYVGGETRRTFLLNGRPWDIANHNVVVQSLDGEPRLFHVDLSSFDESVIHAPIEPEALALRYELEQAVFDTWGEIWRERGDDSERWATLEEYRTKYHREDR